MPSEMDYTGGTVWCDGAQRTYEESMVCDALDGWDGREETLELHEAIPILPFPWRLEDAFQAVYDWDTVDSIGPSDLLSSIPWKTRDDIERAVNAAIEESGPHLWKPGRKLSFQSIKAWIEREWPDRAAELWGDAMEDEDDAE